ncbi:hypothetical protein C1646_764271 [Rhizophagus diaphanus]|nr:hypothetical protein C1646_764271 [Rhizophagus diaphanus] [Rhizophagus sp. MUCL 43196]
MGKPGQLRKTKRKKEANVETYHKTPDVTDMDEESEIEESCDREKGEWNFQNNNRSYGIWSSRNGLKWEASNGTKYLKDRGNRFQTIIIDIPRGYISRVKHGKFYEVSGRLTKSQPLGFVIKEIYVQRNNHGDFRLDQQ